MDRRNKEGIRYISKYVGEVSLSDPIAVTAKLAAMGDVYSNGGVFCTCPELGFEGINQLYCRYGLSVPYYKVKDGDKLWIEPTIGQTERWIYSGFVDCGRSSVDPITPITQGIIENEDGTFTFTLGAMSIVLDSLLKSITIDTDGTGTTKIVLDSLTSDVKIQSAGTLSLEQTTLGHKIDFGAGGVTITTPLGATLWKPNTLPNCLFTGAPHCTITDLKGA